MKSECWTSGFTLREKKKIKTLEEREKWNWDVGFTFAPKHNWDLDLLDSLYP